MNTTLRDEVEAALSELERDLPRLIAETPEDRLMDVVASRIESIEGVDPLAAAAIRERAAALLCREGLVPGEDCDAAEDAG